MVVLALSATLDAPRSDRRVDAQAPDSPLALFGAFTGLSHAALAVANFDCLADDGPAAEWGRVHSQGHEAGGLAFVRRAPAVGAYVQSSWDRRSSMMLDRSVEVVRRAGSFYSTREGSSCLVEVSPGSVRVSRRDYARAERAAETALAREWLIRDLRAAEADLLGPACAVLEDGGRCGHVTCRVIRGDGPVRRGRITSWSGKSRRNMILLLAQLDWTPITAEGAPALVTLTYPGQWQDVVPAASVAARHLRLLRKRFARQYGRPLVGVWKREFQRRGAPHYHLLMVPPAPVNGETFERWLVRQWVDIVDARSCGGAAPEWGAAAACCERHRHQAAHQVRETVDRREGARYADPRRIGVYFSKHGAFADKEYQNEAPAEWLDQDGEGIGRFWGRWGLDKAVASTEVPEWVADEVRRVLRRYSRSRLAGASVRRVVWRKRYDLDHETGEVTGWRWVKRHCNTRIQPHLSGRAGFLVVNDGPVLAGQIAQWVERLHRPEPRSGYSASGVAPPRRA